MTEEQRKRIADRGRFLGKFKLVMLANEADTIEEEQEWKQAGR